MRELFAALLAIAVFAPSGARAETGHDLWLRYKQIEDTARRDAYRRDARVIVAPRTSPTARLAASELQHGLGRLLDAGVPFMGRVVADGTILAGTPASSPEIAALEWTELRGAASASRGRASSAPTESRARDVGDDGYVIRSATVAGRRVIVIASQADVGVLHGVFHFLRLLQTRQPIGSLDVVERPRIALRILDHWDNLDGTIERGYAGKSLWWDEALQGGASASRGGASSAPTNLRAEPKPLTPDETARIEEYAQANASIGINGAVLNNVNAKAESLSAPYLAKAAAMASLLRPYGIRVYLSANFAAPRLLGKLSTADPLDQGVARWWAEKAAEIYKVIPDFGGFLVKANSEGQPGPQDYKRTHADGANVLADAVRPFGGIVMWRAFVYNADVDPDRTKRAYLEFVPLDGKFRDNVLVQVKNGPLDFQPREPFNPLFGAMPKTPVMAELQITQEYLGQSNHLVYLAPMWKEVLDADTYAAGPGSTVAKVIDGTLHGYKRTAIAGVANTGRDANWTGHDFGQANWYAYGRLAWNPGLSAEAIADEWIRMTWGDATDLVSTIKALMLESREIYVDYTMPLGLHHLIGGDHYAPMPENADPRRLDWTAVYYHRADASGIGFDRTANGSNLLGQYRSPLRERWSDLATCPENLLLWFHHLPWDHRLASGGTLWDGIVRHYRKGADDARAMVTRWETLKGKVDEGRYQAVLQKLQRQAADAAAWRDKCLQYFAQVSRKGSGGILR